MSLPSQWFYRRRGFASGVAIGGAGIGERLVDVVPEYQTKLISVPSGGGVSTLLVRKLLTVVGYKKTLWYVESPLVAEATCLSV
jgi:hypothetical protein